MTNRYRIQYTEVKPGGSHARQDVTTYGDRSDLVRYLSRECGNVLEGSVTIWENVGNVSDAPGVNIGGLGWNPDAAPAALDIPAAVRAYIEAEWRGAGIIALNVAQAGIVTALMTADPNLTDTAATFRFHSLVAEMRDNDSVEPTPVSMKVATDTTAESLAAPASVEPAAATTAAPVVPTVLPGQRVRITGGRFAGIETTPSEIQASGWLRFTTNARRGYGIERQNVAPGNWEPVPYSTGLHEFAPEAGGTICVTPCLRPDGTVQPCGDPVKGAIHDPQAYAAYAAELAAELAKWVAAPATTHAKATTAGARVLRRFVTDARVAELNGGTLIFGGRSEASAVRKLVRDGLLERVRETSGCRLTDAGRAWLTANSAAYRML